MDGIQGAILRVKLRYSRRGPRPGAARRAAIDCAARRRRRRRCRWSCRTAATSITSTRSARRSATALQQALQAAGRPDAASTIRSRSTCSRRTPISATSAGDFPSPSGRERGAVAADVPGADPRAARGMWPSRVRQDRDESRHARDGSRIVAAVHGRRLPADDPAFEQRAQGASAGRVPMSKGLVELYARFMHGDGVLDHADAAGDHRRGCRAACGARPAGRQRRRTSSTSRRFDIRRRRLHRRQDLYPGPVRRACVIGDQTSGSVRRQLLRRPRPGHRTSTSAGDPGPRCLARRTPGCRSDVPIIRTDLDDQAGPDRRLGGHRHQRRHPAGRHVSARVRSSAPARSSPRTSSDFAMVAGVPARFLRWRRDDDHTQTDASGEYGEYEEPTGTDHRRRRA